MDAMECQVCLQSMVDRSPRALPCLHTFCEECLIKIQDKQAAENAWLPAYNEPYENNGGFGLFGGPHPARGLFGQAQPPRGLFAPGQPQNPFNQPLLPSKDITCPTCRRKVDLPTEGVKSLPVNFMISQMNDLHNAASNVNCRQCQLCKKPEAQYACETCVKFLCNQCKTQHDSVPAFARHAVRRLQGTKQCEKHQGEALYVCTICVEQICVECVMSDQHQSHKGNITEYDKWVKSKREELDKLQNDLMPTLVDIQDELQELNEYQTNIAETFSVVNTTVNLLKRKIDQHHNLIKEELTAKKLITQESIQQMQKVAADAEFFAYAKEDGSDANSSVRELDDLIRKGKHVKESAEKLDYPEKTWFTFVPEAFNTLGTLSKSKSKPEISVMQKKWKTDGWVTENTLFHDGRINSGITSSNIVSRQRQGAMPDAIVPQDQREIQSSSCGVTFEGGRRTWTIGEVLQRGTWTENTSQNKEVLQEGEGEEYICPRCDEQSPDLDSLELHVQRCFGFKWDNT